MNRYKLGLLSIFVSVLLISCVPPTEQPEKDLTWSEEWRCTRSPISNNYSLVRCVASDGVECIYRSNTDGIDCNWPE